MSEAITPSTPQTRVLAAQLLLQARSEGLAILAAVAGLDATPGNAGRQSGLAATNPITRTTTPVASQSQTSTTQGSPSTPSALVAATVIDRVTIPPSLLALATQPNESSAVFGPTARTLNEPVAAAGGVSSPPAQTSSATTFFVQATAAARADAVIRQGGLAPLLADLETAVALPAAPLTVRQAGQQTLDLRLPLSALADPKQLQTAAGASGLFLEARLLVATQPAPSPATDMKAALLVLMQALRAWTSDLKGRGADTSLRGATSSAERDAGAVIGAKTLPPAPPVKGAPSPGQSAQASTLSTETSEGAVQGQLLQRTEAALSRHTLLQLASIRAHEPPSPGQAANGPNWMFEIPVATPQGSAVMPFEISRDGGSGSGGMSTSAGWRVRFALDIEPAGPVAVSVSLRGDHATVVVAAEREDVTKALSQQSPTLVARLADSGLTAEVKVHNRISGGVLASPGQFVSQAT